MDLLMNGLLLAATCFAGSYCWVLARRVRDLKSLDSGLGGAIVTLTRQVELARTTLEEARSSSRDTKLELAKLVEEADTTAGRLRLLIAAAPHPAPARPEAAAEPPVAARPTSHADALVRRDAPVAARDPEPVAPPPLRLARRPAAAAPTIVPEDAPAAAAPAEAAIQIPTLDRLAAGPLARPRAPEADPARPAPHLAEVPKPRALAPIENPLRRLRAAPAKAEPPSAAAPEDHEDALLEALSALAGGR